MIAALLAGLVYLNALHNPFVYDDYHTVVANASLQHVTDIRAIVLHDVTRPIVNCSYALDRALWGATTFGFHVTNVLLHVLNVVLLFHLARRLSDDRRVAFASATLFAVHPMMTEAVGYISGRSEVLCATFFLSALLCGRRWLRGDGPRWAALTVACWIAALASKEPAAMFPFVLLAYDFLALTGDDRRRRLLRVHVPLAIFAVVAGLVRVAVLMRIEYPSARVHWPFLLLNLDVLRRYVGLMFFPRDQALFHEVAPPGGLFEPRALVAILVLGLIVALAWRLRRASWIASLGLAWFLLLLVPSAALIMLDQGEPMTEHRVYLASVGLFLAGGVAVRQIGAWVTRVAARARPLVPATFALVIFSFGAETVVRNRVWSSPVTLWRESVDLAPGHYRPRLLLGEALQETGRLEEAAAQFRAAVRLRPTEPMGHVKLGRCLAEMGQVQEARREFLEAVRLDPQNVPAKQSIIILDAAEARLGKDAGRR